VTDPNESDGLSSPECGRVHAIWERALLEGGRPGDDERDEVREHVVSCAACAGFVAALESFDDLPPLPAGTVDDVLDARDRSAGARRRKTGLLAAGLVAAAAAVTLVLVLSPARDDGPVYREGAPLIAADGSRWVEGGTLATVDEPLRLRRGDALTVALDRSTRARVAALREDSFSLGLQRGCVAVEVDPAAALSVAVETAFGRVLVQGTIFAVETTGDEVRVEVLRGTVKVESPDLAYGATEVSADQSLAIRAKRVAELDRGRRAAILALLGIEAGERAPDGERDAIAIRVEEGPQADRSDSMREDESARPESAEHEQPAVTRPEAAHPAEPEALPDPVAGEPAPQPAEEPAAAAAPPSPGELIRVARERRLGGDWAGAAEAYSQVLALHPSRPEAVTVLLPLAEIELEHLGKPSLALGHFTEYTRLRPNGALAQEAAFGRCTALRAMGQSQNEIRALEKFLERFPGSVNAKNAKARLEELKKTIEE